MWCKVVHWFAGNHGLTPSLPLFHNNAYPMLTWNNGAWGGGGGTERGVPDQSFIWKENENMWFFFISRAIRDRIHWGCTENIALAFKFLRYNLQTSVYQKMPLLISEKPIKKCRKNNVFFIRTVFISLLSL